MVRGAYGWKNKLSNFLKLAKSPFPFNVYVQRARDIVVIKPTQIRSLPMGV